MFNNFETFLIVKFQKGPYVYKYAKQSQIETDQKFYDITTLLFYSKFRETRVKYDIAPDKERDTVFFRQNISYEFVRELSVGPDTDTVNLINAPLIVSDVSVN